MERTEAIGRLLRVEAERRGMRQADTVLVIGDGGNWVDPLSDRERLHDRRKGWPIDTGVTESAVKQFNKCMKGTEQFWSLPGVESILALRAAWLAQDDRWHRYWNTRPAYSKAA